MHPLGELLLILCGVLDTSQAYARPVLRKPPPQPTPPAWAKI